LIFIKWIARSINSLSLIQTSGCIKSVTKFLKNSESASCVFPNDRLVPFKNEYDYLTKGIVPKKSLDSYYLLKSSLDEENFLLITSVSSNRIYGQLTSNIFLYLASLVPIILIIGLVTYYQMRKKTIKLETNVKISSQNINELADANTLLADEINRRNILEKDLRESEERYRTYIDQAPEGILVIDDKQMIVEINPSLCNLLGLTKNNLLGKSIAELTLAEDRKEFVNQFTNIVEEPYQYR
jgi:PAS domain-containing protein